MESMFQDAESFTDDLSAWDVSSVTNMSSMFHDATVFNSDLQLWNTLEAARCVLADSRATRMQWCVACRVGGGPLDSGLFKESRGAHW